MMVNKEKASKETPKQSWGSFIQVHKGLSSLAEPIYNLQLSVKAYPIFTEVNTVTVAPGVFS